MRRNQDSQWDVRGQLSSHREEEHEVVEGLQDPIRFTSTEGVSSLTHLKGEDACWEAKPHHPGPPALSPPRGGEGSAAHGQLPSMALAGPFVVWEE